MKLLSMAITIYPSNTFPLSFISPPFPKIVYHLNSLDLDFYFSFIFFAIV